MKFYIISLFVLTLALIHLGASIPDASICPIGTDGAPARINPGIASEGLCRGACGMNCPSDRCKSVGDIEWYVADIDADNELRCVYSGVLECPSHQGCRVHDACYDQCAVEGHTELMDECHQNCNQQCYDDWGKCECAAWADVLPWQIQGAVETGCDMQFDGNLYFFGGEPTIKVAAKPDLNAPCMTSPWGCDVFITP